jgi:hypothetical protein
MESINNYRQLFGRCGKDESVLHPKYASCKIPMQATKHKAPEM